jgi:hypothetical protein
MNTLHARQPGDPAATPVRDSLEASDDFEGQGGSPRYCPTGLLASFSLLMAGRGRCVSADMMLGDREYAMWQLACARATDDPELTRLATRLFAYFDDPQHSGVPMLGMA